jgi:hypothetical protein
VTSQSLIWELYDATANFTLNFRASSGTTLAAILSSNQSVTMTFIYQNATIAYAPTTIKIDGATIVPFWEGGTSPTGYANSLNLCTFIIIKLGSSFSVFASLKKYV